jgi:hypothetical protein
MDKYGVTWHAIKTGKSGLGTGTYPKAQAKMLADSLNKENVGITTHGIERVPSTGIELIQVPGNDEKIAASLAEMNRIYIENDDKLATLQTSLNKGR